MKQGAGAKVLEMGRVATGAGGDIAGQLKAFIKRTGLSQGTIAKHSGLSPTTINQLLNRKYGAADQTAVESKVRAMFADYDERQRVAPVLKPIETKTFKRVYGALQIGQRTNGLTVIGGAPGCGKTLTVKAYTADNPGTVLIMASWSWRRPWAALRGIFKALTGNTPRGRVIEIEEDIISELSARPRHLIINDAHNFDFHAIDALAHISEVCDVAVSLVGHDLLVETIQDRRRRDHETWDRIRSRARFVEVANDHTKKEIGLIVKQILPDLTKEALAVFADKGLALTLRDVVKTASTVAVLQGNTRAKMSAELVWSAVSFNQPVDRPIRNKTGPKPRTDSKSYSDPGSYNQWGKE